MPSLRYEILLPLFLFLKASLGQQEGGHGFKTQVQVEEHGMKYHQTVEYDPVTTAVTITVPKHGEISASTVIMHKPSDTQMLMDPLRKYCELKQVPAHFDPLDLVLGSQHMAANNQAFSPEIANEVKLTKIIRGKLSLVKRKQLLKSIRDLCENMPIYIVDEIDITDAEFENGFITINSTNADKRRSKRSAPFWILQTCRHMADRCTTYNVPGAIYCQWYVTCSRRIFGVDDTIGHCKFSHYRNGNWKCVACCDDDKHCEANTMCRCDYITSIDTFNECQKRPKQDPDTSSPPTTTSTSSNPFVTLAPPKKCDSNGQPV